MEKGNDCSIIFVISYAIKDTGRARWGSKEVAVTCNELLTQRGGGRKRRARLLRGGEVVQSGHQWYEGSRQTQKGVVAVRL